MVCCLCHLTCHDEDMCYQHWRSRIRNILCLDVNWTFLKADIFLCIVGIANRFSLIWKKIICFDSNMLTFYILTSPCTTSKFRVELILAWGASSPFGGGPWFILDMGSINERRRYFVTSPLIGWIYTQNDPRGPAAVPLLVDMKNSISPLVSTIIFPNMLALCYLLHGKLSVFLLKYLCGIIALHKTVNDNYVNLKIWHDVL